MVIISIFLVLVILIVVLFFTRTKANTLTKDTMNSETKTMSINTTFDMSEGQAVKVEGMLLKYTSLVLPPESFKGNPEEYTYPNFTASENGDDFSFSLNENYSNQYYHEYLVKLISREGKNIKVQVEKVPLNTKVSEEMAVKKALEIAKEQNAPKPEAKVRILSKNTWKIEMSLGPTDSYMTVEIDANTGEVINTERANRA